VVFDFVSRRASRRKYRRENQRGEHRARNGSARLRLEELEARDVPAAHFYVVPGAAGTQTDVVFKWVYRHAVFNNEAAVYAVQDDAGRVNGLLPSDPGYSAAALSQARVIFESRETQGTQRDIMFAAGTRLGFMLTQGFPVPIANLVNPHDALGLFPLTFFSFDAANPDQFDHVRNATLGDGSQLYDWEDLTFGGDQHFHNMMFTVSGNGLRASAVPGQSGQTTPATFTLISNKAAFHNEMGIVTVDGQDGHIGNVKPGDPGYANAALTSANRHVIFARGASPLTSATVNLPAGSFFEMYLVQNATTDQAVAQNPNDQLASVPRVFFSSVAANPDGFDHLLWMTANIFRWEDMTFGGDQNFADLVGRVDFGVPQGSAVTTTFDLAPASDTGPQGDQHTSDAVVTLIGKTLPNAQVLLQPTGATTTSDAGGNFTFTGVSLAQGPNALTVRATDAAGATSQGTQTITRTSAPAVITPISDVQVAKNASPTQINLANNFSVPNRLDSVVRFNTVDGPIDVQLLDQEAPRTVTNFLNYVKQGAFLDSIFHRSMPGFVIQGGGFAFHTPPARLDPVATDPPVLNEFGQDRSNVRGTIAMAKVAGDPNSATSEFFFNLADNSSILDPQNGGFTVFGRVLGNGMQVVDQLAAIPTQDQSAHGGDFANIPLINYNGTHFPSDTTAGNYALISNVAVTQQTDALTYSVVGNTNPALVTPAIVGDRLSLQYAAGQTGTAIITVRATDRFGESVDTTFKVTVT
jgi:cyclophilin family peptidyl-prolyl cis-trans isomerase